MKDYKKILEGVVNIINTTEKSDIGFANICTYIGENCPELKESEDERIRKALVEMVHDTTGDSLWVDYDVHKEDALAWLEKQGEQKFLDDIAKEVTKDKDAAISFLKSTGIMNENGELADEYKIEQGEQNYQEKVVDNLHNYLYGEQRPVWSEEDELHLKDAIHAAYSPDCGGDELIDWLKSLKDRVQPQSTWRPSDEQIYELTKAVNYYTSHGFPNKILDELLKQLKNL